MNRLVGVHKHVTGTQKRLYSLSECKTYPTSKTGSVQWCHAVPVPNPPEQVRDRSRCWWCWGWSCHCELENCGAVGRLPAACIAEDRSFAQTGAAARERFTGMSQNWFALTAVRHMLRLITALWLIKGPQGCRHRSSAQWPLWTSVYRPGHLNMFPIWIHFEQRCKDACVRQQSAVAAVRGLTVCGMHHNVKSLSVPSARKGSQSFSYYQCNLNREQA